MTVHQKTACALLLLSSFGFNPRLRAVEPSLSENKPDITSDILDLDANRYSIRCSAQQRLSNRKEYSKQDGDKLLEAMLNGSLETRWRAFEVFKECNPNVFRPSIEAVIADVSKFKHIDHAGVKRLCEITNQYFQYEFEKLWQASEDNSLYYNLAIGPERQIDPPEVIVSKSIISDPELEDISFSKQMLEQQKEGAKRFAEVLKSMRPYSLFIKVPYNPQPHNEEVRHFFSEYAKSLMFGNHPNADDYETIARQVKTFAEALSATGLSDKSLTNEVSLRIAQAHRAYNILSAISCNNPSVLESLKFFNADASELQDKFLLMVESPNRQSDLYLRRITCIDQLASFLSEEKIIQCDSSLILQTALKESYLSGDPVKCIRLLTYLDIISEYTDSDCKFSSDLIRNVTLKAVKFSDSKADIITHLNNTHLYRVGCELEAWKIDSKSELYPTEYLDAELGKSDEELAEHIHPEMNNLNYYQEILYGLRSQGLTRSEPARELLLHALSYEWDSKEAKEVQKLIEALKDYISLERGVDGDNSLQGAQVRLIKRFLEEGASVIPVGNGSGIF